MFFLFLAGSQPADKSSEGVLPAPKSTQQRKSRAFSMSDEEEDELETQLPSQKDESTVIRGEKEKPPTAASSSPQATATASSTTIIPNEVMNNFSF